MLRTKIICTIGPASRGPDVLATLMRAGMNIARLNMSHGSQAFHIENTRRIRSVAAELDKPVAILMDLQGPKLRVGDMGREGVNLPAGRPLALTIENVAATAERVPVQFQRLPQVVDPGDRILIDDGLLELLVAATDATDVHCRVITGGLLRSNKGMNLPKAHLSIPAITEKDKNDLIFALDQQADWIALSFVRQAAEVHQLKEMIRELSPFGRLTPVIAKIEKPEAVENIDSIIAAADGIMVARGDLGVETSPEAVPMVQKRIITKCNQAGVPVITATQMLDSMIRNPRPTRAEASDVANAILDGTDAIMLSGETAVGKYPVRAVQTMTSIAEYAERDHAPAFSLLLDNSGCTITEAVCHAAVDTAHILQASAIIVPTVGGTTARTLAKYRPPCPIIAVTPSPTARHQLALYWGVLSLSSRRGSETDQVIADAIDTARNARLIQEGQTVVITAGAVGTAPGLTDLLKVHTLARTLARGYGVGSNTVVGRVRRLEGPIIQPVDVDSDEIIVTTRTDRSFVAVLRRVSGLISSEGQPGAHCHLLAQELGLPAVIGVGDNLDAFLDGQWIVLDSERGVVTERLGMRG